MSAEGEFVRSLFVTLKRGLAGKPWFHQRVIKALGLRSRHHCVEKPNNESIRGMLQKVSHLVVVETDQMFYLRNMKRFYEQLPREPVVIHHGPAAAAHLQQHHSASHPSLQDHIQSLLAARGLGKAPQGLAPVPLSLQSPKVVPHLLEHLAPLPRGKDTTYASQRSQQEPEDSSLAGELKQLVVKRAELVRHRGLFHPDVQGLNTQVLQVRQQLYDKQVNARQAARAEQDVMKRPKHLGGFGRGSRRGMMAAVRASAAAKVVRRRAEQAAAPRQQSG